MNIDHDVATAARDEPGRARARRLTPRNRKLILVIHVAVSVGWLGIAAVMVVIGVTLRTTDDPRILHGGYRLMEIVDNGLIIPTTLLTLISGVLSGLGTTWGLLKHYWVLAKLGLVLLAIANGFFFLHEWTSRTADGATGLAGEQGGFDAARTLLIGGNVTAVLLVASATVLSIYKPWGKTVRGRRKAARRHERRVRHGHEGRTS
jgi:hypothetical protein